MWPSAHAREPLEELPHATPTRGALHPPTPPLLVPPPPLPPLLPLPPPLVLSAFRLRLPFLTSGEAAAGAEAA